MNTTVQGRKATASQWAERLYVVALVVWPACAAVLLLPDLQGKAEVGSMNVYWYFLSAICASVCLLHVAVRRRSLGLGVLAAVYFTLWANAGSFGIGSSPIL